MVYWIIYSSSKAELHMIYIKRLLKKHTHTQTHTHTMHKYSQKPQTHTKCSLFAPVYFIPRYTQIAHRHTQRIKKKREIKNAKKIVIIYFLTCRSIAYTLFRRSGDGSKRKSWPRPVSVLTLLQESLPSHMAQRLRLTDIAVPSSALAERGRVLGIIWSSEPVAETTGKCTHKKKEEKKSVTITNCSSILQPTGNGYCMKWWSLDL